MGRAGGQLRGRGLLAAALETPRAEKREQKQKQQQTASLRGQEPISVRSKTAGLNRQWWWRWRWRWRWMVGQRVLPPRFIFHEVQSTQQSLGQLASRSGKRPTVAPDAPITECLLPTESSNTGRVFFGHLSLFCKLGTRVTPRLPPSYTYRWQVLLLDRWHCSFLSLALSPPKNPPALSRPVEKINTPANDTTTTKKRQAQPPSRLPQSLIRPQMLAAIISLRS